MPPTTLYSGGVRLLPMNYKTYPSTQLERERTISRSVGSGTVISVVLEVCDQQDKHQLADESASLSGLHVTG